MEFVSHMTSEEVLSTFVTTEITALKNGTVGSGLNDIQREAAEALNRVTGMAGAVQDTISGEAKSRLFESIPRVVTGQLGAAEAVEQAMKLNESKN